MPHLNSQKMIGFGVCGLACLPLTVAAAAAKPGLPPKGAELASRMLDSNILRGQGLQASNASTGLIELGVFQQALRESIETTHDRSQKQRWQDVLSTSTSSAIASLSNATKNTELPLDRLSIGSAMIWQYQENTDSAYLPAIKALQQSVRQQKQNQNGGLWYYDNVNNVSAYHNLSYLDGMFSYAPFAILTNESEHGPDRNLLNPHAALNQLNIIRDITKQDDHLSVHGYDASKAHAWADPVTGASPVVWGRSLAWYTVAVVNSLELLMACKGSVFAEIKALFNDLVQAQLRAVDRSLSITGSAGVWQIVDRPDATINGVKNFVEASASAFTAYSLLKGARLGFMDGDELKYRAETAGREIFEHMKRSFLIENSNGTLSFNGTSSVASLSGNADFTYYVTRPVVLNSLIGTSAFILAANEVAKL